MLNDRDLATVLAALRYWQARTDIVARAIDDIASPPNEPWSAAQGALDNAEIDWLCERLNRAQPLAVEVSAWRYETGGPGSDIIQCNDEPDRADGYGVYVRNPLAFHIDDFARDLGAGAAFAYADDLAAHLGCSVTSALSRPIAGAVSAELFDVAGHPWTADDQRHAMEGGWVLIECGDDQVIIEADTDGSTFMGERQNDEAHTHVQSVAASGLYEGKHKPGYVELCRRALALCDATLGLPKGLPVSSPLYDNVYECSCGHRWEDRWDSGCDDECGECGATVSPSESTCIREG